MRSLTKILSLFVVACLHAQVLPVGSVDGTVKDAAAAVVAAAEISLRNIDTGQAHKTTTNENGYFYAPLLPPGRYQVVAGKLGFKKATLEVTVSTGRRSTADLRLEVGDVTESVEVHAIAPLLETSNAAVSQSVQRREVHDLPLLGRNPLKLMVLSPGVNTYSTTTNTSNLTDISGTSYLSANGSNRRLNEFLLDGIPNNLTDRIAHIPTVDVVQEFTVQTNALDAEYGHGGGAYVNVTTKSGTNEFHGTAYEFVQNDKLNANSFFNNRQGVPKAPLRYNQMGGAIGGPLLRNKTFWFFNFESVRQNVPRTAFYTAPTDLQRRGDLSQTFDRNNQLMVIYDPFSTRREGSQNVRDVFPGNRIPAARVDPVALRVMGDFPSPNTAGVAFAGTNNLIANLGTPYNVDSANIRLDNHFRKHQLFGRWMLTNSEFQNQNPFAPSPNDHNIRDTWSVAASDTITLSPTMLLTAQLGYNRQEAPGFQPPFDPSTLGFPTSLVSQMQQLYYPKFTNSDLMFAGSIGGFSPSNYNTYALQASLHVTRGKHNMKFGYQSQIKQNNGGSASNPSGSYTFTRAFTQGPDPNRTGTNIGNGIASFLLGTPASGTLDLGAFTANTGPYYGGYFQDDFKVTQRLTLNLGLRWEVTRPATERYNRNVFGFDLQTPNPIQAQAQTNYARSPIAELPVQNFKVHGGLLFTSPEQRRNGNTDWNNWGPRIGAAYRLFSGTVLRAGVGTFYNYYWAPFVQTSGYSASSSMVSTLDGGLTPSALLRNPFPQGLVQPIGSSQGLATLLGQSVSGYDPNRKAFASTRWSFGFQQKLDNASSLEINYVGQRGYDLPVSSSGTSDDTRTINFLPANYLSLGSRLQASVPNPFVGLIPSGTFSFPTIAVQQLLMVYPHFASVNVQRESGGRSTYHSLQMTGKRQMTAGLLMQVTYTWSKLLETLRYVNLSDPAPSKMIGEFDNPHRATLAAIYELPLGQGRRFANSIPVLSRVIGGWQAAAIYIFQSGSAVVLPAALATGIDPNLDNPSIARWFDTAAMRVLPAFTLRTTPYTWGGLRQADQNNWDLSIIKDTSVFRERVKLQFRAEFMNAFNRVWFGSPNVDPTSGAYGQVSGQANQPRNIQLALKLVF